MRPRRGTRSRCGRATRPRRSAMQRRAKTRATCPGIALPPLAAIARRRRCAALRRTPIWSSSRRRWPPCASMLQALRECRRPVAWLCKGVEPAPVPARRVRPAGPRNPGAVAPGLLAGVLSGPSFAQEVAQGQPTALVAASAHAAVRDALVAAFHGPSAARLRQRGHRRRRGRRRGQERAGDRHRPVRWPGARASTPAPR